MTERTMVGRVAAALRGAIQAALPEGVSINYGDAARAAIEAMREPTDAVMFVVAGSRNDWRAAIDAALSEEGG